MGDTWDTVDTMDTPMPIAMLTMASALLMLNPRLMLTPTFSMVDMDMDTLDTVDTMDTPWWICLLWISYNHQSPVLLQKMDKTTINVFFFSDNIFSAWVLEQETKRIKYKEINN